MQKQKTMVEELILQQHHIKATANRITILRTLLKSKHPLSMNEICDRLETVDKSVVSRTLTLFRERGMLHAVENGNECTEYELCKSSTKEHDTDQHIHFHCIICKKTFCFENVSPPDISIPDGFKQLSVNYMIKGICPSCKNAR